MARLTPEQQAEKWAARLSGATNDIAQGIDRVTEAPGAKAARQKSAYLANIQAKADKWERNVGRVTLNDWQTAAKNGVQRVAQGAQAKKGKMQDFLREFQPFQDRVTEKVRAMPRGTLEQNLARMVMQARETATFKRTS
jgi:hypothetical protein